MAQRGKGFGLTAECEEKIAGKWDPERAKQAEDWIKALTDKTVIIKEEGLKNGKVLCELINKLKPGSVKKVNESKMAFKMMENIGNFLTACGDYGVLKSDLFQTVDLYEERNLPQVVDCIHALGRRAQNKGFGGPTLGPKESLKNVREFSEEQKRQGQSVIGLQMGSNKGASQAGSTPYSQGRQIV